MNKERKASSHKESLGGHRKSTPTNRRRCALHHNTPEQPIIATKCANWTNDDAQHAIRAKYSIFAATTNVGCLRYRSTRQPMTNKVIQSIKFISLSLSISQKSKLRIHWWILKNARESRLSSS